MATKPVFELVQRESGLWAILRRTGSTATVVETGHVDRNLAALDLDSWRSSRQLSEIGQGWIRVADRLTANTHSGRYRKKGLAPPTKAMARADFLRLLMEQDYRCAVSGSYFTHDAFDTPTGPFQPSVDRLDNSRGYDPDNVRIVCLLVNQAMGNWGEEPLRKIARRIVALDAPGLRPDGGCPPVSPARRLRLIPCEEKPFPINEPDTEADVAVSHSPAISGPGNTDSFDCKGFE